MATTTDPCSGQREIIAGLQRMIAQLQKEEAELIALGAKPDNIQREIRTIQQQLPLANQALEQCEARNRTKP
jgi:hypothetical protein